MYIKIIQPSVHGSSTYTNTGSCGNLVDYLSKENEKLPLDKKELFFNQTDKQLSSNAVIQMIDTNIKGVAKGRTTFHSLIIAPDSEELKHIKHDPEALKKYTCEVMSEYAKGFNLKNGKQLRIEDLVWAAKLETERKGEGKNGDNMHIHVIVSARDKEQKISLSPNVNNKQRFNRVQFCLKSEQAFDKMFKYERIESRLQTDQIRKYGSLDQREKYFSTITQKHTEHQPSQPKTINTNTIQGIVGNLNVAASTNVYEEPKYNRYKKKKKKRRPKL